MFKHLYRILFITLISLHSWADFKDANEAVSKLKSYSDNFYAVIHDDSTVEEETKKTETVGPNETELKKIDDFFADLESAVKILLLQKPMDANLVEEVVRLGNISLQNDSTRFAAEVIAPAFEKDSKVFKKAFKKLPKADAKSFEKSIKGASRELKKGNG